MTGTLISQLKPQPADDGFGLPEFLVSTFVLLVIASSVFTVICETQEKAGYQAEVQSVLNNTRLALQAVGRHLRQAGNDPMGTGLAGITIVGATEMQVRSDITGSAGPASPDKGDPDGDIDDSGENVTIRYNGSTRSLEIVPMGGSAQIITGYISGVNFRYYDSAGNPAATGDDVRIVNVTVSGASLLPDPRTHRAFGMELSSDFQVIS